MIIDPTDPTSKCSLLYTFPREGNPAVDDDDSVKECDNDDEEEEEEEEDDIDYEGYESDDGYVDEDLEDGPFYENHIPKAVTHIVVYSNMKALPGHFLKNSYSGLKSIDLSPLANIVTSLDGSFLTGCTGLEALDLSPLSGVASINGPFLEDCTGLKSIDLTPPLVAANQVRLPLS